MFLAKWAQRVTSKNERDEAGLGGRGMKKVSKSGQGNSFPQPPKFTQGRSTPGAFKQCKSGPRRHNHSAVLCGPRGRAKKGGGCSCPGLSLMSLEAGHLPRGLGHLKASLNPGTRVIQT